MDNQLAELTGETKIGSLKEMACVSHFKDFVCEQKQEAQDDVHGTSSD